MMFICGLFVVLLSLCSWVQGSGDATPVAPDQNRYLQLCITNYTSQNIININVIEYNSSCDYTCYGMNVTYEPADGSKQRFFEQRQNKPCGLTCISILNMTCLSGECVYTEDIKRCGQKMSGTILNAERGFLGEKQCQVTCESDIENEKMVQRANGSSCYDWDRVYTPAWCGDDGKCRAHPKFVAGTNVTQICEDRNQGHQGSLLSTPVTNRSCEFFCWTANATQLFSFESLSLSDTTSCGEEGNQCLNGMCMDQKVIAQCSSLPTAPKPITFIDLQECSVFCDGPAVEGQKFDFNLTTGADCFAKMYPYKQGTCDSNGACIPLPGNSTDGK